jgi:hypothetical protein
MIMTVFSAVAMVDAEACLAAAMRFSTGNGNCAERAEREA